MRTKLVDSGKLISKMNVVLVARDCANSIQTTFALFQKWEKKYDCEFFFIFVENGSKDNTRDLIKDFLKNHHGVLGTPDLADVIEAMPRVMRIAEARNKARELVKPDASWTLVLDADIYSAPEVLEQLFAHNPSQKDIAMLCAFGLQIKFDEGKIIKSSHYYDTFTLTSKTRDILGNSAIALHYPICIFEGCEGCEQTAKKFIKQGRAVATPVPRQGLFEVASAFGGLAIINTGDLLHRDVKWFTQHNPMLSPDGSYTCEHIYFCRSIANSSGKKIVVATDCEVYWDGGPDVPFLGRDDKNELDLSSKLLEAESPVNAVG